MPIICDSGRRPWMVSLLVGETSNGDVWWHPWEFLLSMDGRGPPVECIIDSLPGTLFIAAPPPASYPEWNGKVERLFVEFY